MLEVNDLSLHFDGQETRSPLLKLISFNLHAGEIVGVLGKASSGKSILIKSILGLNPRGTLLQGEVRFEGKDLLRLRENDLRRIRGRQIGMIRANPHAQLNPLLPIGKQLVNIVRAHDSKSRMEAEAKIERLLHSLSIPDPKSRLSSYPHQLSGGMAQRVLIAAALVNNPKLILADEPTAGLDVTVQLQVLDLLLSLIREEGAATLLVTRDPGIVAQYCNRVLVMHSGEVVEQAPTNEFFSNARHPHSLALLQAAHSERRRSR